MSGSTSCAKQNIIVLVRKDMNVNEHDILFHEYRDTNSYNYI